MTAVFKRLRLQLTAICALGTAAVLVGMAAVSLRFSLVQLDRQAWESFRSNINTVIFHLLSQPVVDQIWLTQTEADNGLWIRIESERGHLQHTRLDETRDRLTLLALTHAREQLGHLPFSSSPGSLEPELLLFELDAGGEGYFACVATVPAARGMIGLTVVKNRAADRRLARQLVVGFSLCIAVSLALLALFAWFFSHRAIRPVEESHRQQSEFVSSASHELRSPLSVIEMSAGTIRKVPDSACVLAEKIERECGRMARLLSDLLFLAGADHSRRRPRLSPASPRAILLTSLERYEGLAEQRGIHLALEPPPGAAELLCDQQRVEQVLSILLDNALRFTPEGGHVLLSGCRQRGYFCFSVSDSGPGVPKEEREKIFQRFYQADLSRTDKEHYGLGLSIAWEIVRLHRGKLFVRDSPWDGAEFVLQLRDDGN